MDTILHIQGDPDSSLAPLILVHAVSGFAVPYLALGALFADDRPVYGVSSPLLSTTDGKEDKYIPKSIRELANMYTQIVKRELQPRGPYLLGGWSFGGVLAAEMANILLDEGEGVTHVFMIDSTNPGSYPLFQDHSERNRITALTYNAMAERMGGTPVNIWDERADMSSPISSGSTSNTSSERFLRDDLGGQSLASSSRSRSGENSDEDDEDLSSRSVLKDVRSHIGYGLLLMSLAPDISIPSTDKQATPLCTLIRCQKRPPPSLEVREYRRKWMVQMQRDNYLGWEQKDSSALNVLPLQGPSHDEVFDAGYADKLTVVLSQCLRKLGM